MENMNSEMKAYLEGLPVSVKTAIIESGASFETLEQLKVLAKAYMGQEQ